MGFELLTMHAGKCDITELIVFYFYLSMTKVLLKLVCPGTCLLASPCPSTALIMLFIPFAALFYIYEVQSDLECIVAHVTFIKSLLILPGLVFLYHLKPITIFFCKYNT